MGEDCIRNAKAMGFKELCRLPGAFNHKKLGFVDAVIFFQEL